MNISFEKTSILNFSYQEFSLNNNSQKIFEINPFYFSIPNNIKENLEKIKPIKVSNYKSFLHKVFKPSPGYINLSFRVFDSVMSAINNPTTSLIFILLIKLANGEKNKNNLINMDQLLELSGCSEEKIQLELKTLEDLYLIKITTDKCNFKILHNWIYE